MRKRTWLSLLVVVIFNNGHVLAGSQDALETFKSFKGKWRIEAAGKLLPIEMTYEDGSKGSIITEQFGKELSVFHKYGNDVIMTHFCNAGYQSKLKLRPPRKLQLIEFEAFDVTNLKTPQDDHVKRVTYKLINDKKMELEITWKKGEGEEIEKYTLTKI